MQSENNSKKRNSGIILDDNIEVIDSKDNIWRYVINAFLIFGAVYGTIKCFVSAFEIECYPYILALVLMIISLMYAFMHISIKVRKISYAFIFTMYITIIVVFRVMLKSGFSRIINVINEFIEKRFNLPVVQRYAEYYGNRKLSVTLCLIVIGFVMGLVLNIIISEYMSIFGLLITTLPIAQIGMYFDLKIDYVAYILYVITILVVLEMNMSGKYCIIDKNAIYRKKNKKDKIGDIIRFKTEPKIQVQICMVCFVVTFLLVFMLVPLVSYMNFFDDSEIKDDTNVYAKEMVMFGIDGTTYSEASGGVGGGKLGDVSAIKNKYNADLRVTFVPMDNKRIYLKGYIGAIYNDNEWKRLSEVISFNTTEERIIRGQLTEKIVEKNYISHGNFQRIKQKMKIENKGANEKYVYLPYYTTDPEINIPDLSAVGEDYMAITSQDEYVIDYYPRHTDISHIKEADKQGLQIKKMAYDYYTTVPLACEDSVKKICDDMCSGYASGLNYEHDKDDITKKENISKNIVSYLSKNYKYSLKCGKTPKEYDFVSYFLEKQKKGICSHFASSATMMFRYMGIPARYVEGYVIDAQNIEKGEKVDEKVEDYIEFNNSNYKKSIMNRNDLSVTTVDVPDSNAHAWVEIYYNNFGWVPVEVTPVAFEVPASMTDKISTSFTKVIDKILQYGGNKKLSSKEKIKYLLNMVTKFIIALSILALIVLIVYCVYKKYKIRSKLHNNDIRCNVKAMFDYICRIYEFCGFKKEKDTTFKSYIEELAKNEYLNEKDAKELVYIVDEANYSEHDILSSQEKAIKNIADTVIKERISKLPFIKRIVFYILIY